MKRRFIQGVMILSLLILVVACSNGQDIHSSDHPTPSEKTNTVELTISAAASLKDAMTEIKHEYNKERPEVKLNFNFGASGALQQQISQGAPVDLFFSAAQDKFDLLVQSGDIVEEDGTDLVGNRLVLVVPKNQSDVTSFEDLSQDHVDHISIGTPESVPAGKYAKEFLENMNLWESVKSKIVYAKDVRQVLSYVETGNVKAGIVYSTDAIVSDKIQMVATADPQTHAPIIYPVGVIKHSKNYEEAKDFYSFLQSDQAIKIFKDYGFTTK